MTQLYRKKDNGILSAQKESCDVFSIQRITIVGDLITIDVSAWEEGDDAKRNEAPNVVRSFEISVPDNITLSSMDTYFLNLSGLVSNNGEQCDFTNFKIER